MPLFSGRFTTKKVQSPVKDSSTNDTPSSPPKEESKPISDTPTEEDDPAVNADEARTLTHNEETGLWVVTEKANDSKESSSCKESSSSKESSSCKEEEYDSSPTKSPTKTSREKNSTSRFNLDDDNNKDKQYITSLEDENRLLKLKMEILIDMINDLLTN